MATVGGVLPKRIVLYRFPAASVPAEAHPIPVFDIDHVGPGGEPLIPEGFTVISHAVTPMLDGDLLFSFMVEKKEISAWRGK